MIVPDAQERELVHRVIYDELCLGRISHESRELFLDIIEGLAKNGAEGIILGCTEIGLLINEEDCHIPIFDTTRIHAMAAVEYSLSG